MRVYKTVFNREKFLEINVDVFLQNPHKVIEMFELDSADVESIPLITDKSERNVKKRDILPAANFADASIFTIDIDNIYNDEDKKLKIVDKLSKDDSCLAVKESISGGISAFFKFNASLEDFPFVYYKKYLELTLLLSVNIDFLPDVGRLRFLSTKRLFHYNSDSEVLTEKLDVDVLPAINANVTVKEGRRIVYGSR